MEWLNTIGLVLNIAGVALLAIFPVAAEAPNAQGSMNLVVKTSAEQWHKNILQYFDNLRKVRMGYSLIAMGFILQLIASWPD
tara:strand:- start:859 stop:1104 length:246 start_codon:yes stop_codon:yes gene_type:complete